MTNQKGKFQTRLEAVLVIDGLTQVIKNYGQFSPDVYADAGFKKRVKALYYTLDSMKRAFDGCDYECSLLIITAKAQLCDIGSYIAGSDLQHSLPESFIALTRILYDVIDNNLELFP